MIPFHSPREQEPPRPYIEIVLEVFELSGLLESRYRLEKEFKRVERFYVDSTFMSYLSIGKRIYGVSDGVIDNAVYYAMYISVLSYFEYKYKIPLPIKEGQTAPFLYANGDLDTDRDDIDTLFHGEEGYDLFVSGTEEEILEFLREKMQK